MKLINAGLGRTGTTSLKAALEKLGFAPAYHTTDLFTSPKDMKLWGAAIEGQAVDWQTFFSPYEVADWPVALCYEDIIRAHPETKVMLSVRDPEGWFESFSSNLKLAQTFNPPIPQVRRIKRFSEDYVINGFLEGKSSDKAFMLEFFERHTERVKALVGAENLLIYDVTQGWEPLCHFLAVDVPDEPFPRLNKRGEIKDKLMKLFSRPAKRKAVGSEG